MTVPGSATFNAMRKSAPVGHERIEDLSTKYVGEAAISLAASQRFTPSSSSSSHTVSAADVAAQPCLRPPKASPSHDPCSSSSPPTSSPSISPHPPRTTLVTGSLLDPTDATALHIETSNNGEEDEDGYISAFQAEIRPADVSAGVEALKAQLNSIKLSCSGPTTAASASFSPVSSTVAATTTIALASPPSAVSACELSLRGHCIDTAPSIYHVPPKCNDSELSVWRCGICLTACVVLPWHALANEADYVAFCDSQLLFLPDC